MAASMVLKGACRARLLCAVHRECDVLHSLQRPQCRYKQLSQKTKMSKKVHIKSPPSKPQVSVKFLQQVPEHSIYMKEEFPPQTFMLDECIKMHKEAAQPAMMNNLHTQLYADMELNLTTKKKTKPMKDIRGLLMFPHKFHHGQTKNIMVFSECEDDLKLAQELGATHIGGEDFIQQIHKGMLHKDDLAETDFVMCTPTMAAKITLIRPILRDKQPTLKNGLISTNLGELIQKHLDGVKYASYKEADSVGRVQIPIGQLHQDLEELEENFTYMVNSLSALKPQHLAPLIQTVTFLAPPSEEKFDLKVEQYVEGHKVIHEVEEEEPAHPEDSDDEVEQKASSKSR